MYTEYATPRIVCDNRSWLISATRFAIFLQTLRFLGGSSLFVDSQRWESLYETPIGTKSYTTTSNGTHIFSLYYERFLNRIHIFDIETKKWSTLYTSGSIGDCSNFHSIIYSDNSIFAQATCSSHGTSAFLLLPLDVLAWQAVDCAPGFCPSSRVGPFMFLHNGVIHLCDGEIPGLEVGIGDVWSFDKGSRKWAMIHAGGGQAPSLSYPCYTYHDGRVFMTGGQKKNKELDTGLWIFSFESIEWQRKELNFRFGTSCSSVWALDHLWVYSSTTLAPVDSNCVKSISVESDLGGIVPVKNISSSCPEVVRTIYNGAYYKRKDYIHLSRHGGLVVISGGNEVMISRSLNSTESLDWEWSSLDYYPIFRNREFFGLVRRNVYLLFGGLYFNNWSIFLNDVWLFYSEEKKWDCLMREHQCAVETNTTCGPLLYSSASAIYNSSLYVLGSSTSFSLEGRIFRQFSIDRREWAAFVLHADDSNFPFTGLPFGVGYAQSGARLWMMFGSVLNNNSSDFSQNVYEFNLEREVVRVIQPNGQTPPPRRSPVCAFVNNRIYIANGFLPGYSERSDIWSFDPVTNKWTFLYAHTTARSEPYVSGVLVPYQYPILIMGSRLYPWTLVAWMITDNKGLLQVSLPKNGPGSASGFVDMQDQTATIYSTWRQDTPSTSILRIALDKLFCSSSQNITVSNQYVLEDGSGSLEYMLGTNCTWNVFGGSWIQVDFVDIGIGGRLMVEALGLRVPLPQLPGIPEAISKGEIGARDSGRLVRMASDVFSIKFEVSTTATTRQGFKLTLIKCEKGFVPVNKVCTCPSGCVITHWGQCVRSSYMDSLSNLQDTDRLEQDKSDARLSSYASYLGSAVYANDSILLFHGLQSANANPASPYFSDGKLVRMGLTDSDLYRLEPVKHSGDVPDARYSACMVTVENRVWMLGGASLTLISDSVFSMNLTDYRWSQHAKTPFSTMRGQVCLTNRGVIYAIGGVEENGRFGNSYAYNIASDRWLEFVGFREGPKLSHGSGAVFQDTIYVFGGWDGQTESSVLWKYGQGTPFWMAVALQSDRAKLQGYSGSDFLGRQQSCGWLHGSEMHLFGGLRSGSSLQDLLVIDLETGQVADYQKEPTTFVWPPRTPQARYGALCVQAGDAGLLLAGATDSRETAHDVWVYVPEMRVWINNSLSSAPLPRRDFGMALAADNNIVIFGGTSTQGRTVYLNDLWLYWTATNEWQLLSSLYRKGEAPTGRDLVAVGEHNSTVFIFGGRLENHASDSLLWAFNKATKLWSRSNVVLPAGWVSGLQFGSNVIESSGAWIFLGQQRAGTGWGSRSIMYSLDLDDSVITALAPKNEGPSPRFRAGLGRWGPMIIVCSGLGVDGGVLDDVWTFDTVEALWTKQSVSLGSRRLLPAFASSGLLVAVLGEEVGSRQQIQVLNTDSKALLRASVSLSAYTEDFSGQRCVWNDRGLWMYGGQTGSLYLTQVYKLQPSTCSSKESVIRGDMAASMVEDGSLDSPYFSPFSCSWSVTKSNTLEIEYSLAVGDRLVVDALENISDESHLLTLSGNRSLISSFVGQGFRVELRSNYNLSHSATGFRFWHAYCPPHSTYQPQTGCTCERGYRLDDANDSCIKCKHGDCASIGDPEDDLVILEIVLPISIVGVLVLITLMVCKHYRRKLRGHRVKYERRMMLGDKQDFILGDAVQTERIPQVYRGTMRGQYVEIDVISSLSFSSDELESRLDQISMYRHPNIQLYMGACFAEDHLWIAMEWMGVGTLSFYLRNQARMHWRTRVDILLQIANGISFLHNTLPALAHGNLSSATVLIDNDLHVKISGVPRSILGIHQDVSHPLGKAPWCAPEVLLGNQATGKSDAYSFAIIAWEVSTNGFLYPSHSNKVELAYQILANYLRPDLPEGFLYDMRVLIEKCWSSSPEARPDFVEIINQLKTVVFEETPVNSSKGVSSSHESLNPVSLYVLAIRIWKDEQMWSELTDQMLDVSTAFYLVCKKVFDEFQMDFVIDHDCLIWCGSSNISTCLRLACRLLSCMASGEWPGCVQSLYTKLGLQANMIDGLRAQMVISGSKNNPRNASLCASIQQSLACSCKEAFQYCEGGQVIMKEELVEDIPPGFATEFMIRKVYTPNIKAQYVEVLHTDFRQRARYFAQQNEAQPQHASVKIPNSVPEVESSNHTVREPMQNVGTPSHLECVNYRQSLPGCSLPSVWSSSLGGQSVVVRQFAERSATFSGKAHLKLEVYRCKKWSHPNIAALLWHFYHQSNIVLVLEGSNFTSLDAYAMALPASSLNSFRFECTKQIVSALLYLHGLEHPQAFRGLDWRNVRVVGEAKIQLGFAGFSYEFRDDSHTPMVRVACRAPEVLARKKWGVKSDVYSLGVLLWELAMLSEAFVGIGDVDLGGRLFDGQRLDLSLITSEGLGQVIDRACMYNDHERPSISEILPKREWWLS